MHEVIAVVALQTAGFLSTKPDDLRRFRKHPASHFGDRGTGTQDNTNTQSSKESRARSQLLNPLKTHMTELSRIHRRTQNHSAPNIRHFSRHLQRLIVYNATEGRQPQNRASSSSRAVERRAHLKPRQVIGQCPDDTRQSTSGRHLSSLAS